MKQTVDTIQHLLSLSFLGCLLLGLILAQAALLLRGGISVLKFAVRALLPYVVKPWRPWTAFHIAAFSIGLWIVAEPLRDALQIMECKYIAPVYADDFEALPDDVLQGRFEALLFRHTGADQFPLFRDSIGALAGALGVHPNALYSVMYSESGLDPFCVRKDGKAAGLIQFTPAGLSGLGVSLDRVKRACKESDGRLIMSLTSAYMKRAANGRQLSGALDVYLAVFAPGKIGAGPDVVLYSGVGNPAYDLNAGLDGWHVDWAGRIVRARSEMDGRITAGELGLCLERRVLTLSSSP